MASPQAENGHIDIANTIADKLCSYRLSGQEWQVIWVILRKTWGWLEHPNDPKSAKKKMDRIALSQFADLTGIDRRKCHEILKKLIEKNIIKKVVTQKGDRPVITYGFQKNFDLWKVSPKKVTVTQKGDKVSPKKMTKLSPKKAHTKEKKETTKEKEIYKENLGIYEKLMPIPKNYSLQPEHVEYAESKKLTIEQIEDQFESFIIHFNKTGKKHKNWYAAFQSWTRNAIKWGNVTISETRTETPEDVQKELEEAFR